MAYDPDAPAAAESGLYGLTYTPDESKVIAIPVPFEATTSYGSGAAEGPGAILRASHQVDLFDLDLGKFYEMGITMLDESPEIRAWNDEASEAAAPVSEAGGAGEDPHLLSKLAVVNRISDEVNAWVYREVGKWLDLGKIPCIVGGDHAVPFGAIRAYAERNPGMGILHLDAHADLRNAYEGFQHSHASIFFNVMENIPEVTRLVQVGIRDFGLGEYQYIQANEGRIFTHYDQTLANEGFEGRTWRSLVDGIVSDLPEKVYLSFDIDGLEPSLCPHTGTPVPGGLSFQQACALIAGVVRSGRTIVGLDLCEVAPGPDGGEWDGNVGARLLYKMIGWMLHSQKRA